MKKIALILVVVLVGLFLAKGVIARAALSIGVRAATGVGLQIRKMSVGVFRTRVIVEGVTLVNPRGFPERRMADLPELYVDYDLPGFLKGQVHLRELRVNLKEFVVIKNAQGKVNIDSFTAVKESKKKKEGAPTKPVKRSAMRIDELHLKVGRVVWKDYTQSPAAVRTFEVNLDERHHNITNPAALGGLIVSRALFKTGIASLADLDLGALQGQVQDMLKKAGTVGEDTWDKMQEMIPFGRSEEQ